MKTTSLSYPAVIFLGMLIHATAIAQVSINPQQLPADPSAMLDIQSTHQGLLMPRMNQAQKLNIAGPAMGLVLYQHDGKSGIYTNQGDATTPDWSRIATTSPIYEARIPLDSVCPSCTDEGYDITEPGAYYLTRDIENNQTTTLPVIEISCSNVSLDLNGFTISYIGGASGTSKSGIEIRSISETNIVIKNGAVKDFPAYGVEDNGSHASIFQDLIVSGNGSAGLEAGNNATILNVISNNNLLYGITARRGAMIRGCIVNGNANTGMVIRTGSHVVNCQASENGEDGIYTVYSNSLIEGCHFSKNERAGAYLRGDCLIRSCVFSDNGELGIYTYGGTITQCIANGNGTCVASGNCTPTLGGTPSLPTCPEGTGICGRFDAVVTDNYANDNVVGIFLNYSVAMAYNNYCEGNSHQGFVVMPRSTTNTSYGAFAIRNTCHNNGIGARASLTAVGLPAGEFHFSGTNTAYGPQVDVTNTGDLLNKSQAGHPAANFEY